jgi:hypothetical protein
MNDEYCTDSNCGTCTRQDVAVLDDRVHLVNYVGKYVVQTMMAPEVQIPMVGLGILLAPEGDKKKDFPIYFTLVGFLGDESASIADSKLLVEEDDFMVWYQRHNDDEKIKDVHAMVVDGVKSGTLDLSTAISTDKLNEDSRALGVEYGFLNA